jgi:hypothetical protein
MTRWSWIMVCVVLAGFLMFLRIGIKQAIGRADIREFHNVQVLAKNAKRVYTVKFQELATPMTIRLCDDGDDLPLEPGMIIDPFQYIQKPGCLLINEQTFVDYKRDEHRNTIIVDKDGKFLYAKEN